MDATEQTREDLARAVDAWAQTYAQELNAWAQSAAALASLTLPQEEPK